MSRDPGPLPTLEFLLTEFNEHLRSLRATAALRRQAAVAAAQERATREAGKWAGVSLDEWKRRALATAGIDPGRWDPTRGFEANRENGRRVYEAYAGWYLKHPELKWAGLAKLAGAAVHAGLTELHSRQDAPTKATVGGGIVLFAPWLGVLFGVGGGVAGDAAYDNRLEAVETIFLGMQKAIFDDIGWQHQAYAEGGLSALKAAYDRGDLTRASYEAWTNVASGDPEAIWDGAKAMAYHEQSVILGPGYADIRGLVGGGAISAQISDNAVSPVPGGAPFARASWGDVTDFEDRWRWIEEHMLPDYRALGEDHTRVLVAQPLDELARRNFAPAPATSTGP